MLAERTRATIDTSGQKREPGAVSDPSFELKATAEGSYEAEKPGRFQITIRPKGKYHLNLQYPVSIAVKTPQELSLAKSTLDRTDASVFSEQLARFELDFTPSAAGTHRVEAQVAFAICTPKVCIPKKESLILTLSTK